MPAPARCPRRSYGGVSCRACQLQRTPSVAMARRRGRTYRAQERRCQSRYAIRRSTMTTCTSIGTSHTHPGCLLVMQAHGVVVDQRYRSCLCVQARHSPQGRGGERPARPADERGGVEEAGRAAVQGLGALHGPQTRYPLPCLLPRHWWVRIALRRSLLYYRATHPPLPPAQAEVSPLRASLCTHAVSHALSAILQHLCVSYRVYIHV